MKRNDMSRNNTTSAYPGYEKLFGKFLRPGEHIVWGGTTSSKAMYREKPGSRSRRGYILCTFLHFIAQAGTAALLVMRFAAGMDEITDTMLIVIGVVYVITLLMFCIAAKAGLSRNKYAITDQRFLCWNKKSGLSEAGFDKITASSFKKTRKKRDTGYIELNTSTLYRRMYIDGIDSPEAVFKILTDAMALYRRTGGNNI